MSKSYRRKLIKESRWKLDKMFGEIDKEFYPLSFSEIDLSNKINYLVATLNLAQQIIRDIDNDMGEERQEKDSKIE